MLLIFFKINIFWIGKKFWKVEVSLFRFVQFPPCFELSKCKNGRGADKKVSKKQYFSTLNIPGFAKNRLQKSRIIEIWSFLRSRICFYTYELTPHQFWKRSEQLNHAAAYTTKTSRVGTAYLLKYIFETAMGNMNWRFGKVAVFFKSRE